MMDQLMIPGRVPQGASLRDKEMLASIFSALPEGTMMKALEAVGVQVKDPQSNLAQDDGQNAIQSWNDRRVAIKGDDSRPPVWDRNKVIEMETSMPRGREPAYMHPDFDSDLAELNVSQNVSGGF